MDRHHESLQNEELYGQCGELIKDNIVEIQKEISSLMNYLRDQKRELVRKIRVENGNKTGNFEVSRKFYEHALKELLKVQQVYEECLLEMKIDLSTAASQRLQPPSFVPLSKVKRAYEMSNDPCTEVNDDISCRCTWKNVPLWSLPETRNILIKPPTTAPTEFDESDQMFKQEMTLLRRKMFSLPKKRIPTRHRDSSIKEISYANRRSSLRLQAEQDYVEISKGKDSFLSLPVRNQLAEVNRLKFVDGEFATSEIWTKVLDIHGNQLGSKWNLVLRPQIENIVKKRQIPAINFKPAAVFDFLLSIPGNGINFSLLKEDLIPMVENHMEALWLKTRRSQFQAIEGRDVAATVIQTLWRGYWLRKRIWESERLYIAASLLWYSWISLQKKREMHENYLAKMLKSLHVTREQTLKLSNEFDRMVGEPHVVIHLTSLGFPMELRRGFVPNQFAIHQNITSLRISFVRNPKTEVIYVLPVKPTQDLLTMYSDIVESVSPDENVAKRIAFIALSQADTFRHRSLNVSRILHCSEESLEEIRKRIAGKSAYFLPWLVDECDIRLAGTLGVPLLSADVELQSKLINMSKITEVIEELGLLQPAHARDIKDYDTLCSKLAELIVLNTEVCSWLIKLNFGAKAKHYGVFLINHISVPFMPILRREREKHGDEWAAYPSLREEFLDSLYKQLPKVLSTVTKLSEIYKSWKEFYSHVQKFGCLLQAIPVQKNSSTVSVALFVHGKASNRKPKWLGTADRIYLESTYSTVAYMLPQTSTDTLKFKSVVNKFAEAMQSEGYFGYLGLDCYCYPHKEDEKLVVLILNVFPYYSYLHSYVDWMKFAIGGLYNYSPNTFTGTITVLPSVRKRKFSYLLPQKTLNWDETTERYAVAVSRLFHTRLSAYRWSKLKVLLEESGISYNAVQKQGSHLILHDGELKNSAALVAISSNMTTTLAMVHNSLKKLHRALVAKSKKRADTNFLTVADYFSKLSLTYQNLAADPCA